MTRMSLMIASLSALSCARPDPSEVVQDIAVHVATPTVVEDAFIEAIRQATTSLHVALPATGDALLYEALLDAWLLAADDPDFTFELILDVDQQAAPGAQALIEAGAPVQLADGGLSYFEFTLNDVVTWTSEQTLMSHAYVIVDELEVVAATTAGDLRSGPRVWFELRGEDLIDDLLGEHNQVFGGVDATTVTAFDAPAKSIADFRWHYLTAGAYTVEMWFAPQERPTKRVIDAVYGARSAVWIIANDLANDGLARALKEKARWGFDVRVVVGPDFGADTPALSNELRSGGGDIQLVQVDNVDRLPNVVLLDVPRDREGYSPDARAMVLTHDLVSSARLYRQRPVVTDQLIDGALFVVSDRTDDRAALAELTNLFQDLFDQGVPL